MCSYNGCNASFKKNSLLKRHMLRHTDERPYLCDIDGCSSSFQQLYHLNRHKLTIHSQSELHVCDEDDCNKIFMNRFRLKNHIARVHSPATLYQCSLCLKEFKRKYRLRDHILMHARKMGEDLSFRKKNEKRQGTSKNTVKCSFEGCGASYTKFSYLWQHMRKHTGERPFLCDVEGCDKSYANSSHLNRHKASVHERATECICKEKDCGRVLANHYSLQKHIKRFHSVDGPFKCFHCMKGFSKKYRLRKHLFVHLEERGYKCKKCNIGFPSRTNYLKHIYNHRTHKTYTCDCGKVFELWMERWKHQRGCETQKIGHICNICNKSFTTGFNLKQHYTVHSEVKEIFKCPYLNCDRSYNYKKNLKFHIQHFHEKVAKSYECPIDGCSMVFSQKQTMDRHVLRIHKNPKPRKTERKPRKDKGISKTCNTSAISGLNPSFKNLLKNPHIQISTLSKEKESKVASKEGGSSKPATLEDSARDGITIENIPDARMNVVSDVAVDMLEVCYSAENSRGSTAEASGAIETTPNSEDRHTNSNANVGVKRELIDDQSSSANPDIKRVSSVYVSVIQSY
nr:unnamed protein product [Callosobruchus analis]